MSLDSLFLQRWLRRPTLFGVKLWILIVILVPLILLIFIIFTIFHIYHRHRNRQSDDQKASMSGKLSSMVDMNIKKVSDRFSRISGRNRTDSELECQIDPKDRRRRSIFGLEEIESATNRSGEENVVVIEDHSVDNLGNFDENAKVSVKRFNSNISFAEFIVEAERMRQVSHKNLVKLHGYCTERSVNDKILIYEKVDNGNLHQWLHECPQQPCSPLTWPVRMNIIQGIAKGLAYLHEDVEPQILHGSLKSSNILLDEQWNPKIADFGLNKLFGSDNWAEPFITETLGFESLENGSISPFTEKNDVYSFGVLIMEMISGKIPVACSQSQPYLVEWVKSKVENQQVGETVDSRLEEKPFSKELKRMLLIALRCVDPEMEHRPTMGQILHMLEPRDLLLSEGYPIGRGDSHHFHQNSTDQPSFGEQ